MTNIKEKERCNKLKNAEKLISDLLEGREPGEKEGYISIDKTRKKYK